MGLTMVTVPIHAESTHSSQSLTADQMKELKKLQVEMYAIELQLDEIRQKALQASPDLKIQQDKYQSLLLKTMKEQGNNPDPVLARMHQIEKELKNKDLSKDKHKHLVAEYQQKTIELQRASYDAVQIKQVHKAAEDLSKATVTAMSKQEAKTEELLHKMDQLRQQMQQLAGDKIKSSKK